MFNLSQISSEVKESAKKKPGLIRGLWILGFFADSGFSDCGFK